MRGDRARPGSQRLRTFAVSAAGHIVLLAAVCRLGGGESPHPSRIFHEAQRRAIPVRLTAPQQQRKTVRVPAVPARARAARAEPTPRAPQARFVLEEAAGSPRTARPRPATAQAPELSAKTPAAPVAPAIEIEVAGPRVREAGFARPAAASPASPPLATARTGVFGAASPGPRNDGPPSTAAAGFAGAARGGQGGREIAPGLAGIGSFGEARPGPRGFAGQATTAAAGFGRAARADRRPAAPAESRTDRRAPLRILEKPRPAYTPAARERGVEGEVALRVLFRADGTAEVLEILSGLGYGLDETAVQAARAIRFEPAERDGAPVDVTAVIRITFQTA